MSIKYSIKKDSSKCVFCNKPQQVHHISKCKTCDWKMCRWCFFDHLIACDQVMDNYQQQLRIEWND